jgi:hypothetical protein
VRPPPSPWVETIISIFAFIAPEWGLFASACVSAGGLCLAEAPLARLSPHQKFPFPARVETGSVTGWSLPAPVRLTGIFGLVSLRLTISLRQLGSCARSIGGGWEFDHVE